VKNRSKKIRVIVRRLALAKLRARGQLSKARVMELMAREGYPRLPNETRQSHFLRFIGKTEKQVRAEFRIERKESRTPKKSNRPPTGAPHPEYIKDDGFYASRDWRELRYLALRNTDGRCQCCGGTAKDDLRIHVDHIQPRYKRPDLALSLDNLQVLCEDCNIGKGAWDQTDWRGK